MALWPADSRYPRQPARRRPWRRADGLRGSRPQPLAWEAAERVPCTTIQLNTHFLDGIRPGEFIELRGEVTRRTRGLVFLRGVVGARNTHALRDVGSVDGVWRVLRPR